MAMQKIAYKSFKWEKEKQKDIKRYADLKGLDPILKNMELILGYEKNKSWRDINYVQCYTSLYLKYHILAERTYLRNISDRQAIYYTYLSGLAGILAYLVDSVNPTIKRDQTDQENLLYNFSYSIMQFYATQNNIPQCLVHIKHPYTQLFLGYYEKAVELLSFTSSIYNPAKPYTILMGDDSCETVQAMAHKDEKALNNLLIQHVKAYRKQPIDYSTFIDAYSTAYVKLAQQNGLNCELDIIEIPRIFFDNDNCKTITGNAQLPFFNEAIEYLKNQGFEWY